MNHDLFTNRQLIAAAIDQSKITDQPVQLIGFLRKIRKMGRLVFVDLVDTSGELQLVFQASKITSGLHQITHLLKESVISVSGRIYPRKAINPEQKNGQWEMQVDSWSLVNAAQQLTPFVIDQQIMATEETKLKYRYLELRSHLGERIKARSQIMNLFRQFLLKKGFIEVITPILGQSTIEGARDYLVPTRTKKDPAGFALPQSPQIYKQLLMIGGLERYFQIAINFRDEDLRADRQPEFVQLDIEQAYTNTPTFLSLMEQMFGYVWEKYFHLKLPTPFLQMDYQTAINQYGTDKPDLRFDLLIEDLTNDWKDQLGINNEVMIRGILVKKILSLAQQTTLYDLSLALGLKHFFCFTKNDEQYFSQGGKKINLKWVKNYFTTKNLVHGTLIIAADKDYHKIQKALGQIRLWLIKTLQLVAKQNYAFVWIVNWPLFEYDFENESWTSAHHPFTQPQPEFLPLFQQLNWADEIYQQIQANAYDLVVNGIELGSGSARIYDSQLQTKMLKVIGLDPVIIKQKFGWFIEAFNYGVPPHQGIGLGLDRIIQLILNTTTIRDVIAFPKSNKGTDLMQNTPGVFSQEQLTILGLQAIKNKKP